MNLTYEQGQAILDALLFDQCPNCHGTGKVHDATSPEPNHMIHCINDACVAGRVLNGLGDAILEFIGDYVKDFAEVDHGHYLGRHD